jgi:Ca-activated chloride channel family protein
MRTAFISTAVLALFALTTAMSSTAPVETGRICGVVKSDSGKTLAYANIIVDGTTLGAMSLADGKFCIEKVPVGTYTVRVMMMGYKAVEKKRVKVEPNVDVHLEFQLEMTIVAKTQEVVVTADKPMVAVGESKATEEAAPDRLVQMPIDDVLEAVALKAGIVKQGDEMRVRGGRGGEVQIQIDGAPVDDPLAGSSKAQSPPSDAGANYRIPPSTKTTVYTKKPLVRNVGPMNTESYARIYENEFRDAMEKPFSTFSIDVDAASYANVRRYIDHGQLPPPGAVRIEEMINYFDYDYPEPEGEHPFSITAEVAGCPWNREHQLVHVGLQGRHVAMESLPRSNLVFLLDVSGSMQPANKLPLLRRAFRLLAENLRDQDRVAIVVYAGSSGLVLPSTRGDEKDRILEAIDRLRSGGSTAGASGIRLAYQVAEEHFIKGGNNRVILATDGDFNVGVTNNSELIRMIEEKREGGVYLSVLGFGEGNLKDDRMEQLADKGNGNYNYIDSLDEARRVLVGQMAGTLFTIAKDVKIQLEFNPARVESYRLIGYENRVLAKKDFDDDKKDAGELGAGHSVTALYEIVPATRESAQRGNGSRYTVVSMSPEAVESDELLTLRLRYKPPESDTSTLIEQALRRDDRGFEGASENLRFSAAVAAFGMWLRGSEFAGEATVDDVIAMAESAGSRDEDGYRKEFVELVRTAGRLAASHP